MYEALAERRLAGMEREQNFLMDQIDKIYGVRSGARYRRAQPGSHQRRHYVEQGSR